MLGVVVNAASTEGFSAESLFEDFLGVPLLARAIAATLPLDDTCSVFVLLPEALHERAQIEIKERFGFDEIDAFIATTQDAAKDVRDAAAAFPEDIDFIALTTGHDFLAPAGLMQKVLEGAQRGRVAASAIPLAGLIAVDEDNEATHFDNARFLRRVQGPLVFIREEADKLLQVPPEAALQKAVQGETAVTLVEGDADHLQLTSPQDLTKALEVFHRRAIDFAFVYPQDLLPDDPLKKILDENETRLAQKIPLSAAENDNAYSANNNEPTKSTKSTDEDASVEDDAYSEELSIEEGSTEA